MVPKATVNGFAKLEKEKKRGLIMSSIIDNISRCQAINVETIDYDSKTTHILVSM